MVWSIFGTTRVDHINYSDLHCQVASRNQHALGHLAAVKQTDPSYLLQLNCQSHRWTNPSENLVIPMLAIFVSAALLKNQTGIIYYVPLKVGRAVVSQSADLNDRCERVLSRKLSPWVTSTSTSKATVLWLWTNS